mmetsp:Transcript_65206/g.187732  ORF Transcript_65206/g.187732 Transcript_65206/m.187732 type:complete len:212 (-) Transcript_65206:1382-2017(-)
MHPLQVRLVLGETALADQRHRLVKAHLKKCIQLRNAPSSLKEPEVLVHRNDLPKSSPRLATVQLADVCDHVVELVHLALDALAVLSRGRRGARVLGRCAGAPRVGFAGHRVHVPDAAADARVLVYGESADPVGVVELVFPEELALQCGQLIPLEPRKHLLVSRGAQRMRHNSRNQVREAIRPCVGDQEVGDRRAPLHHDRRQGVVLPTGLP